MKKWFVFLLLVSNLLGTSLADAATPSQAAVSPSYQRLVILSDLHYPTKTSMLRHPAQARRQIENKWQAVSTVNSWDDVNLVVFTGDFVPEIPDYKTLLNAKEVVKAVKKPVAVIAGNHDFYYADKLEHGKKHRASFAEEESYLKRFRQTFDLSSLYYTKDLGKYLLVFLSPEATAQNLFSKMSPLQMHWLDATLKANKDKPTIIFFHAPLFGTFAGNKQEPGKPSYAAEPHKQLADILLSNPQVKLWVSGHTHTEATDPDFAGPKCWFHGKILEVHNSSMESEPIWINSLYLYQDKIIVKTFNTGTGAFMPEFTRTVPLTEASPAKAVVGL